MKYALTFTTDVDDGWGTTDTIIFETNETADEGGLARFTRQELNDLICDILKEYCVEGAEIIATRGWWFLRNCEDVDIRKELV